MIELRHLRKEFDDVTPLEDVNLTINDGDVIAVIGPSGTGKSTLLRCINMLTPPTSGDIIVNGQVITDMIVVAVIIARLSVDLHDPAIFQTGESANGISFEISSRMIGPNSRTVPSGTPPGRNSSPLS